MERRERERVRGVVRDLREAMAVLARVEWMKGSGGGRGVCRSCWTWLSLDLDRRRRRRRRLYSSSFPLNLELLCYRASTYSDTPPLPLRPPYLGPPPFLLRATSYRSQPRAYSTLKHHSRNSHPPYSTARYTPVMVRPFPSSLLTLSH